MGFLDSVGGLLGGASPWGSIASGIGGIVSGIFGGGQKKEGKKLLKEIGESPNESIPTEVLQNQKMAQARANQGLPSEQYSQAMRNLQRQQVMQLRNAHTRRGGLATIAGGQQDYNNGLLNLDVTNANAKMQNERALYGVNNTVGNWRDKVWQNNVKDVWNRKYQMANSLLGKGNQNVSKGIDSVASAGIGLLSGGSSGYGGNAWGGGRITPSNTPKANQDYIPYDEVLPG